MKKTALKLGLLMTFATATTACGTAKDEPQPDEPLGPVASNAQEAWPEKPASVPAITAEQIARACVMQAACIPASEGHDRKTLQGLVDLCAHDAAFSAERAIPLSGFGKRNERAEFFVDCTLKAVSCDAARACTTTRSDDVHCEEDGCRLTSDASPSVSCNGSIASITTSNSSTKRDCARAFAQCSEQSPTGCTDRAFSACDQVGIEQGDRCDGDIRLGCDGGNQVSYRDCTRLGGSCRQNGKGACVYPDADARCGGDSPSPSECTGSQLSLCVGHAWISVDAPEICPL